MRLDPFELAQLKAAQTALVQRGLDSLPPNMPLSCPECGTAVEIVAASFAYSHPPSPTCSFSNRNEQIAASGAFALGFLAALGAAALLWALAQNG